MPAQVTQIAERLRITREALGLNQVNFTRKANVSKTAYNAYERGHERPSIDSAVRLCDAHRLSLDWIYRGDDSRLPAGLADAIRAISKARAA